MDIKSFEKLQEEPLKSAISQNFFKDYVYTQIRAIDFVIAKHVAKNGTRYLFEELENDDKRSILWAEAKRGTSHDIYESFVQLILTIGKDRTFEKDLPPKYIGAFDAEKFAFIEYHKIQEVFYQNDFNWNVTPSDHSTKEFNQLYNLCKELLTENTILFKYETQISEMKEFIKQNFKTDSETTEKISVTKNNFTYVFQRWSEEVKPTISIDWEKVNKVGIISADFFLADLLSSENESLKENLYVVLKKTKYELAKKVDEMGLISTSTVDFNDKQKAYKLFWSIYERPPKEEYWDYIIGRRDLLVPQDIRELRGSYFTPSIWVEKSQQYLTDVLGENWQDEYYIWDCCAGTGNLLNGLTNYRNVWASTLDNADVDVMKDRIESGWNMFENHIFQFDFLNDEFSKCPEELQEILNDEEKRKKLVIYINPPYAEAGSRVGGKSGVSNETKIHGLLDFGKFAKRELFAQFLARIYLKLNGCYIGEFSKLKILQSSYFEEYRNIFKAKLEKVFLAPSYTFDNVTGHFPIGFKIWNTSIKEKFTKIVADVFDAEGNALLPKTLFSYNDEKFINDWLRPTWYLNSEIMGYLACNGNDYSNQKYVAIVAKKSNETSTYFKPINKENFLMSYIYLACRHFAPANWLNDRDQFLYPNENWEKDKDFQFNCLIFSSFHNQNAFTSEDGVNYFIPFTESQVGCKKAFKSNFMSNFINGQIEFKTQEDLFNESETKTSEKIFLSKEAKDVYDAGLELWKYYHAQPNVNPDASFYDIRKYFQGETKGKMNHSSDDEIYTKLISDLRNKMKPLAKKIEPKVYEYGFLK